MVRQGGCAGRAVASCSKSDGGATFGTVRGVVWRRGGRHSLELGREEAAERECGEAREREREDPVGPGQKRVHLVGFTEEVL